MPELDEGEEPRFSEKLGCRMPAGKRPDKSCRQSLLTRPMAGRLPQAGRLGPIIWWLAGGLILGLVRRFIEGSNGAPLAVVGLIEIEPNHAHKPFLCPVVGRFP